MLTYYSRISLVFVIGNHRDRTDAKENERMVKTSLSYCPLRAALKPYTWSTLSRVQTKDLNPAVVFTILGLSHFFINVMFRHS